MQFLRPSPSLIKASSLGQLPDAWPEGDPPEGAGNYPPEGAEGDPPEGVED